jgi:elongation factor Ts
MASAEQVRELRARTGAGIMECKKALLEVGDDIDGAIDYLRKQGSIKAAKKSGRETKEGLIEVAADSGGDRVSIIEVNCETDFVARNEDFQGFVKDLAKQALNVDGNDVNQFIETEISGKKISATIQDMISKVGENMGIARFDVCARENPSEKIGSYIHAGSQIGVVVKVSGDKVPDQAVREIAMHITAMHPLCISPDDIPGDETEKEKEVLRASPDVEGKPPEVVEKMVEGRFRKFLSQVCLVEQAFIRDPQGKQTVGGYLKSLDPEASITRFIRYQIGG